MGIEDWLKQVREALDPEAHAAPPPLWPAPTEPWPRNTALEDALRSDADSMAHLAIYADWLCEQDIRGEVLAAALAEHPAAARWGARHIHPGAALEGWMLGPLARTLEIGPRHAIALQSEPFDHASCTLLQTLRIFAPPDQAAHLLATRREPCPIQVVVVGAGYADLTPLWPSLGALPELHVEKARSLGVIKAPALQSLKLWTLAKRTYVDLSAGWLPALTELELQTEPNDGGTALAAALSALPLLQTLGVRSVVSGAFLNRVVQAGCATRLRHLTIPGARWDTIEMLLHHADRFESLETLTLPTLPYGDGIEVGRTFGPRTTIVWSKASTLLRR